MSVQLDLFKQNCDNAASMLLMFEKALPLDKSTCAHKLKDLPIPRGLESEWIFIVDVWMAPFIINYQSIYPLLTLRLLLPTFRLAKYYVIQMM